jgi:hypothetical protein
MSPYQSRADLSVMAGSQSASCLRVVSLQLVSLYIIWTAAFGLN